MFGGALLVLERQLVDSVLASPRGRNLIDWAALLFHRQRGVTIDDATYALCTGLSLSTFPLDEPACFERLLAKAADSLGVDAPVITISSGTVH